MPPHKHTGIQELGKCTKEIHTANLKDSAIRTQSGSNLTIREMSDLGV